MVKHWANSQKYKGHGLKAACIKKEQPVVHREANKEFAKAKRGRAQQRAAIKTEGQEPCSPRPAASHQPVTPAPRPDPLTPSPRPAKPAAELSPLTPSPQPEPAPAKAKPTAQWGKPLSREAKLAANISLDSPPQVAAPATPPTTMPPLGPIIDMPPSQGPLQGAATRWKALLVNVTAVGVPAVPLEWDELPNDTAAPATPRPTGPKDTMGISPLLKVLSKLDDKVDALSKQAADQTQVG